MLKIQKEIRKHSSMQYAQKCKRFFKTGYGEYGHGDFFLGVKSPFIRKLAKTHTELELKDLKVLIKSKYHEERLLALIILVNKYSKASFLLAFLLITLAKSQSGLARKPAKANITQPMRFPCIFHAFSMHLSFSWKTHVEHLAMYITH